MADHLQGKGITSSPKVTPENVGIDARAQGTVALAASAAPNVTVRGDGAASLNTPAKVQASKQAETDAASRGVTPDKSVPEVIDNPLNGV